MTYENTGYMTHPIFLLCDILQNADFGSFNPKNLNKIKKLPLKGKDFIRASGGAKYLPDDIILSDLAIHNQKLKKKITKLLS